MITYIILNFHQRPATRGLRVLLDIRVLFNNLVLLFFFLEG